MPSKVNLGEDLRKTKRRNNQPYLKNRFCHSLCKNGHEDKYYGNAGMLKKSSTTN